MKLSPLTVVAFIAASVTAQGDKKEWTGTLSTIDGGLKGDVSVVNSTMIMITSYSVEASAPALYWWGSKVEDLPKEGFRVNNERVSMNADDETIMIPLDNDKTTADFGQTKLEMPDGDSGSSSSSDSNEVNDNAAKGRNLPFASAVGAILLPLPSSFTCFKAMGYKTGPYGQNVLAIVGLPLSDRRRRAGPGPLERQIM